MKQSQKIKRINIVKQVRTNDTLEAKHEHNQKDCTTRYSQKKLRKRQTGATPDQKAEKEKNVINFLLKILFWLQFYLLQK